MATTASSLFNDLKQALTTFKQFLDSAAANDGLKNAIKAVKAVVPKVGDLLTQLINLMGRLETEITNLNAGAVGAGLTTATQFVSAAKAFLDTAKTLLPGDEATINQILDVVNVVSSLPSLDAIKTEILGLIGAIKTDLTALNAA
jgi:ABC-type transporter Mla subunit MlaD